MKKRNIPFSPPDITEDELNEVIDALKSGWITTGPKTKVLEEQVASFCHTDKAVAMNSATAAMEMVLRLLEVGPGDEVITSAYTYTASASVIDHVGAKIVLVDTAPDSYQMDYKQLENAITDKTKVIIPVDVAGVMCDYDRIFEIVARKKALYHPTKGTKQEAFDRIVVLADAAHSFGATYKGKCSGEVADFSCFSFHAVKNFTTAEGGAVTWRKGLSLNDEDLYKEFMLLILHGQNKDALAKMQLGAWEYDIIGTYHKANMTDIHAAIGLAQMKRYRKLLARRKVIVTMYDQALGKLPVKVLSHQDEAQESSRHLYLLRINGYSEQERNQFIIKMAEAGIATNVHYKPLPMMTAYKKMGFDIVNYPNAYQQYQNEVTLPLHTSLTDEEIDYMIKTIKNLLD